MPEARQEGKAAPFSEGEIKTAIRVGIAFRAKTPFPIVLTEAELFEHLKRFVGAPRTRDALQDIADCLKECP